MLTDCWTSIAVLVGLCKLGLVRDGLAGRDPICGIVMAINILVSGGGLVRSAFSGLMDTADPEVDKARSPSSAPPPRGAA